MTPKHQKITTYDKQTDGSIKIRTESYYERLSHEMEEIEKQIPTSFYTLKKDVESTLTHITEDNSSQLVLTIKLVKGEPKLTKRWITMKKAYDKR